MTTSQKSASPEPLFRPFAWDYQDVGLGDTLPAHAVRASASTVRDLACGAAVVLEMIERSQIDRCDTDDEPLLSRFHEGALMRLAIAAMRMVERDATELFAMQVTKQT
ncbi:hypothetical protein [Sphaerotilus sp.]|uniref:hypothetical protein n=1 Tax=Sphaerotilus sp. TaxID=2093942 RepID=UPI00286DFC61|nr:hypothetical protein [Sphaerotilus sp.]